jgi:hypothetical protein
MQRLEPSRAPEGEEHPVSIAEVKRWAIPAAGVDGASKRVRQRPVLADLQDQAHTAIQFNVVKLRYNEEQE